MNLPDDIMGEILSRLPVKAIGMCRCVSKSIRSLTMEPFFIRAQSQHSISSGSSQNKPFFVVNGDLNHQRYAAAASPFAFRRPPFDLRLSPPLEAEYLKFVGCSGSLVCLSKYGPRINRTGMYATSIYIWNPSLGLGDFIELHPSVPEDYFGEFLSFGFGYDSVNDDYKVVNLKQGPSKSEVYSLRNGTWKGVHQIFPLHSGDIQMPDETDEAVTVNGFMHWPCRCRYYDNDTGSLRNVKSELVRFQLAHEVFEWMSIPEELEQGWELHLAKLSGQLCALYHVADHFELWVMTTYGVVESWVKQYVLKPDREPFWFPVLKGITRTREIILSDDDGREVILYDPYKTGQKATTFYLDVGNCTPFVADYAESLISVAAPLYNSMRDEEETKGEAEQGRSFLTNLVRMCFRSFHYFMYRFRLSFRRKKLLPCTIDE